MSFEKVETFAVHCPRPVMLQSSFSGAARLHDVVGSVVRADLPPNQTLRMIFGEHAMPQAHPSRPKLTDVLESDGRVSRIVFEALKVFVREFTDGVPQLSVPSVAPW
jgi:hypothetical protein